MRPLRSDRSPRSLLSDKDRLTEIVKTLRDCNQDVNHAVVMEQFRYETNRFPSKELMREVLE